MITHGSCMLLWMPQVVVQALLSTKLDAKFKDITASTLDGMRMNTEYVSFFMKVHQFVTWEGLACYTSPSLFKVLKILKCNTPIQSPGCFCLAVTVCPGPKRLIFRLVSDDISILAEPVARAAPFMNHLKKSQKEFRMTNMLWKTARWQDAQCWTWNRNSASLLIWLFLTAWVHSKPQF